MKKVAIYVRSSNGQNINTQLLPLRNYCQRMGCEIVDEYVDKGFPATDDKRPQFKRLLADIANIPG